MAKTDADLQYYVYLDNDWRGPYALAQIKTMIKQGQVDQTTYAYEPQHQTQLTIGDLIAGRLPLQNAPQAASGIGSSGNRDAVADSRSSQSAPRASQSSGRSSQSGRNASADLDRAIGTLQTLRQVCFDLAEASESKREMLFDELRPAHAQVRRALAGCGESPADLRNLCVHLDKVATDIATRFGDKALTAHLVDMRTCLSHADPREIVPAADAVLSQLLHVAEHINVDDPFEGPSLSASSVAVERTGGDAMDSARFELKSLQNDLSSVKDAYAKLQESYAREQKQAHKLVLQLKEQLESEQKSHEGDVAELRALAAEIHDLAQSSGLAESDPTLLDDVTRLAQELQNTVPTTLVPVAEAVLNRVVGGLAKERSHLRDGVDELTNLRADLLKTKSEMSMLRQREDALSADKQRLQKQLDEERGAASRVDQSARAREAQFKSTIAALQITKQLHQEVMGDLQEQLKSAQVRVEDMERELVVTRHELKGTKSTFEDRESHLMADLAALSSERQALEERQNQLSTTLQSAEQDLHKARARAEQSVEDESLAEALAAKVNQLRQNFEETRGRLKEQESSATRMQQELAAARKEASELRSRSDQLSGELDSARGNLDAARKRMEELQRAAERLESERESLLAQAASKGTELHTRNSIEQLAGTTEQRSDAVNAQIATLETQLADERQRAEALERQRGDLETKHATLLAEHEMVAGELTALRTGGTDPGTRRHLRAARDQLKQTESATRDADAQRIAGLEERLGASERELREAAEGRNDIGVRLATAASERERLLGELTRLKAEHEAAAVEHRAAISVARRAQTEAAARAAELDTQLQAEQAEHTRLSGELESTRRDLTKGGADRDGLLSTLADRLEAESTRADRLAKELDEHRRTTAASQVRLARLEADVREAELERDRAADELRRRGERSAERDVVDQDGRVRLEAALERLRDQLERETRRASDLERRLEATRGEARDAATRHAAAAEAYADAVAKADRAAAELAETRSRHGAELADAERRLGIERDRQRELERRLTDADARTVALQARIVPLERELSDAREIATGADNRASEAGKRLGAAQAELVQLRLDAAVARDNREHVTTELVSTTGRHSRLAVTVDRLTKELQQSQGRLEAARAEHDTALAAVRSQLNEEKSRIAALEQRLLEAERLRAEATRHAEELGNRLADSDRERSGLVAHADRLRGEAEAVSQAARGPLGAEAAALRERLSTTEAQLVEARSAHDATARRSADRLLELEQRLDAERATVGQLEGLREQLRSAAASDAAARTALAEVTAARDRLHADLTRLGEELARTRAADRSKELEGRLTEVQAELAKERDHIARLEADVAVARSQQQVASAGREGLEASLSKIVTDRERLIAEVDRLRSETEQLRQQLRQTEPVHQAELASLKQLLSLERDRVKDLEQRLALAYREQGEASHLTDAVLQRRLARASTRIQRLKERLRSERRKTEDLQTQVSSARSEATRLRTSRSGTGSFSRNAVEPGELSSAVHAAAAEDESGHALEPSRPASPHTTRRPELDAGGFVSAFGRTAIHGASSGVRAATDLAPVLATLSQTRGSTILLRRRRKLVVMAGILVGACTVVFALVVAVASLFVPCNQAEINARTELVIAPKEGRLEAVTRVAGDQVMKGEPLAMIDGRDRARTILEARQKTLTQARTTSESSTGRSEQIDQQVTATENEIAEQRSHILSPVEQRRDARWTKIDQLAAQRVRLEIDKDHPESAQELIRVASEIARLQDEDESDRKRLAELQRQADLDPTISGLNGRLGRLREDASIARSSAKAAAVALAIAEAAVAEADIALSEARSEPIPSPVDGIVVRWLAESDRSVDQGASLAQLALPDEIFVETQIPDGREDDVHVGDRAEIEVITSNRRLGGTVRQVLAPGQSLPEGHYVAGTGRQRDRRHRAVILLDPGSSQVIGQGARVVIIGREPGAIKRMLLRVYTTLAL